MHKKILRPLAMTLGLALLPACPADTATTEGDTDTDAATSGTSTAPTTDVTTSGPDLTTSSTGAGAGSRGQPQSDYRNLAQHQLRHEAKP